jgi:hypothetical protein
MSPRKVSGDIADQETIRNRCKQNARLQRVARVMDSPHIAIPPGPKPLKIVNVGRLQSALAHCVAVDPRDGENVLDSGFTVLDHIYNFRRSPLHPQRRATPQRTVCCIVSANYHADTRELFWVRGFVGAFID